MSSSSPALRLGRTTTTVLCCTWLLLLFFAELEGRRFDPPKITTNQNEEANGNAAPADAESTDVAPPRRQPESAAWFKKNKPNKSSSKKYVVENRDDFQQWKLKKSIYDKKYFDYLPWELKESAETPADVSLSQRANSRRFRRSAAGAEPQRTKRHGIWYIQPVASYSYTVPQYIYPNDWRLQYNPYDLSYRPNLHNQYLPPSTTRPVPLPPTTSAPAIPSEDIDPGMRGSFDGDQRPFAFDVLFDPSRDTNYQLFKNTGNQRPAFPGGFTPSRPNVPSNVPGRMTTTTTTVRPFASGTTRPAFPPSTVQGTTTPTTTSRPSIQHNSEDDFDWASVGLAGNGGIGNRLGLGGTAEQPPLSVSPVNSNSIATNGNRTAPSKCTWAIANCCSHNSDKIRYFCFEQNQCYGSFWGENVCRQYFATALKEIENYYDV